MTPSHMNNAVLHYGHLIEQGTDPERALAHTRQRFGVPTELLIARIAGDVAKSTETQEALAEARIYLTDSKFSNLEDDIAYDLQEVLRKLYNAITGEDL